MPRSVDLGKIGKRRIVVQEYTEYGGWKKVMEITFEKKQEVDLPQTLTDALEGKEVERQ